MADEPAMKQYSIAAIPGDGIGAEVLPVAVGCVDAAAGNHGLSVRWSYLPWGTDFFHSHGSFMPDDGVARLKQYDAVFFGAVGMPSVSDSESLWGLLIPIRRGLHQSINLRPVRSLPNVAGPLSANAGGIDIVVVRENSEGEYSEAGGRFRRGEPEEFAVQNSIYTRSAIETVTSYAVDLALSRSGRLVSATKSNGILYTNTLWDEVVSDVCIRRGGIRLERVLVDALAARLVLDPRSIDVIVAPNLYGDILSDLVAALAGSIGIAASGNIDPTRQSPSMFEPVHGSAPDIAGKGVANPVGQIGAAVLMLEHLGEVEVAREITAAVSRTLASGVRTADLGGTATTSEFGDAVLWALRNSGEA